VETRASLLFAVAVALTTLAANLWSQVGTANLSGTVTDPSGAAIPSATILLEGTLQQFTRETFPNPSGQYIFPAIPPGVYKLVVKSNGFREETIIQISLSTGQASTLNVVLALASASETVTVTAAPPLLQTTTATVGAMVEQQKITQLPLLGRNFTSLLYTLPGVSPARTRRGQPFSVGGAGGNPSVFGQRYRNNNFTIDGVSNNEPLFNGIPMNPPPEALAELKIETGMSSGAYGHASGANVNLVTKSGTNELHGDLWEYLRNNRLDSRDFFVPALGPLRYNQFGAAVGGPVVIPRLIPRERGWYFFGYYEGIRIRRAANTTLLVPTVEQTAGDFSGDLPIFNPYTTTVTAGGARSRQPFPNNRIPASLANPTAVTIAKTLLPPPNLAAGVIPGRNFFNPGSTRQDGDQWSGRVDKQFSGKDNIFVRYTDARNPRATIGNPLLPTEGLDRLTNVAVSDTHIFSPSFLVTGRFGLQRTFSPSETNGDLGLARRVGMLGAFPAINGREMILPLEIAGYAGMSQGFGRHKQYFLAWTGDAHKTVGRHAFEFGGGVSRTSFQTNNLAGSSAVFTSLQTSNFAPRTGAGLASYMLGLPESASRVVGNTEGDMFGNAHSLYAQDNWRLTPRLTLNIGLRYDYASPMVNRNGSATFIFETGEYVWNQTNPITGDPANTSRGLIPPDRNNFQPRFGIAFQFNPKTVVRSSYGIFFDTFGTNYAQTQQGNRGNWPFAFPQALVSLNAITPDALLPNPFPGPAQGSRTPLGCQQCLNVWKDTSRTPYVQQWTFSAQRQLSQSLKTELIYFGSHAVGVSAQMVENTAQPPGPTPVAQRRRYPNFPAYVNNGVNVYGAWHQSFSAVLDKRLSGGLSFLASYTWSKSLNHVDELADNTSNTTGTPIRGSIPFWKGPAGWDVPHRLVVSYTYELPFKAASRAAHAVVANWALSGVLSFDTGVPYSVRLQADTANLGTGGRVTQYGNLVGDPKAISKRTPQRWFNTDAFAVPPPFTFGTAGRNILRTDGLSQTDVSVHKFWRWRESRRIEFRAELFNALNTTTFGYPGQLVDVPQTFGALSSMRASGRSIQFGLKFRF